MVAEPDPGDSKPSANAAGGGDVPLLLGAARGMCPRCGASTLFRSAVGFAPQCRACGLDYEQFNVGDGPAAFLTMIVGALVLVLALAVEFSIRPPLWLHVIIWPLLTIACVVGSLRLAKGALLTLEYRNKAREGMIVDRKGGALDAAADRES